ncbi:MAG TPA: ferritin-like domain-containing protein [Solirubrobacteraceae bacterium]
MTEVSTAVSRAQFIRNGAKGSLVLATAGGALASMDGIAFAKGVTKSDVTTLQVAYIAESLAVKIYTAIVDNFHSFKGLQNKDYFVAALKNEKAHKTFLAEHLGSSTPKGFHLHIPSAAVASTKALTNTGTALELAFVETYLGAVQTLSSTALKVVAAKIAADEASHYSFFNAANGGHGVLPAFPGQIIPATKAAAVLTKDGFIS